jgi:hypothetical protein
VAPVLQPDARHRSAPSLRASTPCRERLIPAGRVSGEEVLDRPRTEVAGVCSRCLQKGIQQRERIVALHRLGDQLPSPEVFSRGKSVGSVARGQAVVLPEGSNEISELRHKGTVTVASEDKGRAAAPRRTPAAMPTAALLAGEPLISSKQDLPPEQDRKQATEGEVDQGGLDVPRCQQTD